MLQALCQAGQDCNQVQDGRTPLYLAARRGCARPPRLVRVTGCHPDTAPALHRHRYVSRPLTPERKLSLQARRLRASPLRSRGHGR